MQESDDDERLIKAIRHGCVSGSLRMVARMEPAAAPGLIKASEFHHRAATRLLEMIIAQPAAWPLETEQG